MESEEAILKQGDLWFLILHLIVPYSTVLSQAKQMSKQNGVVFVKMGAAIELESFQTISRMNLYGDVAIEKGKWKLYRLQKVAAAIESWNITDTLYLQENYEPSLLKHINTIKFPYLRKLHIWANNIESLEELSRTWIPNLEILQFCDNHVVSFKAFRKAFFPKLRFLESCNNKGQRLTHLEQVLAPVLEEVILQMYVNDRKQSETFDWTIKLQSTCLKEICLKLLTQGQRLIPITEKKYPNIQLFLEQV